MRNRSLAKSSLILLAVGLIAGTSALAADPVYMWKDSSGQSHYSQTPPADGTKFTTITPSGAPVTGDAAAVAAAPKSATPAAAAPTGPTPAQTKRQELCDTARKNVDTLTNRPLVEMDLNGSGTPTKLTPEQQTQQLNLAKQQTTSYCTK